MSDFHEFFVIPFVIIALIGGLTYLLWWALDGGRPYEVFMTECLQHRRQYECTAIWRGGNVDVAPIVIPVPMRVGR